MPRNQNNDVNESNSFNYAKNSIFLSVVAYKIYYAAVIRLQTFV